MAKKSPVRFRIAPLQRIVAEEITDPVELAALDEAHRRHREKARADSPQASRTSKAAIRVLALCRGMPAEETLSLLTRVAAQLSPQARQDCLARLVADLPPNVLRQLEKELRPRRAE